MTTTKSATETKVEPEARRLRFSTRSRLFSAIALARPVAKSRRRDAVGARRAEARGAPKSSERSCDFSTDLHLPYRASHERIFGNSREAYRRALDVVDQRIAEAIARFESIRGRAPIVVIVGDHGEAFGEHGHRAHASSVYAEQVRVPLVIRVPGSTGRTVSAPVSTAAIAATLVELAGIGPEPSFELRSLVACMREDEACPEVAVSELLHLGHADDVAIRGFTTRTERIIVDRAHDAARIYDLRRDPFERHPRVTMAREAMHSIAALDNGR